MSESASARAPHRGEARDGRALLQELVDAVGVALRRPVLLDDPALVPIAYSPQAGELDAVRTASILSRGVSPGVRDALLGHGIAEAAEPVRIPADDALGMAERICVPVRGGGRLLGYVWVLDRGAPLSGTELERVRTAARDAASLLLEPRRALVRDERPLLQALEAGDRAVRERAAAAARDRGLLPDGLVVACLVASPVGGVDPAEVARRTVRRLSTGHAVAATAPEGGVVVAALDDPVVRALGADGVAAWIHEVTRADVAVGQSSALELHDLHEGVRQARVALRVARSPGSAAASAAWAELGADRIVAQLHAEVVDDVPEALARLVRERGALAQTLATFLDAGGDVKATAAALSLHRSGVYYRLGRIEQLTGLDLASGDDRLLAHLALRAEQMS
jgi:hypothetical protein